MLKKIAMGIGFLALAMTIALGFFLYSFSGAGDDPAFFESEIKAFERADQTEAPRPGAIVFIGSSSIRFWSSLEEDMAPLPVLNRGFGGAHLSHVIHNAPRIVLPYSPRAVVVYAGDNDIAAGKSAERVVTDLRALARLVWDALPQTRIYFVSIKPSKPRFELWPEMSRANREIARWAAAEPRLETIDISPVMLDADGKPRDDVFRIDGLHLNANGYAAWTSVIAPVLQRAYGGTSVPGQGRADQLEVFPVPIR